MKPFDLEKAKAGHPVITRDGREVRIVCFDRIDAIYPIVALIKHWAWAREDYMGFTRDGEHLEGEENDSDLFMKPVNKKYWMNVYKGTTIQLEIEE